MDSTDNTREDPVPGRIYEGVFVDGTDDTRDVLFVTIPAFDGEQVFGDPDGVTWAPLGGTSPQAGDGALVVETETGAWRALAWWNDEQGTGVAQADIDTILARLDAIEARLDALEA